MVELHWWFDDEHYTALVNRESLRYLYELLTSFGGVKDDLTHIYCVANHEKFDPSTMMAMMDYWT